MGKLVRLEALARSLGCKLGSLGVIKPNSEVRHKPSIGLGDVRAQRYTPLRDSPSTFPAGWVAWCTARSFSTETRV